MAGESVVHIGENSPEEVALKLLHMVASNEKKTLHGIAGNSATADRVWILDTYAECLQAVTNSLKRYHEAKLK